MCPTVVTRRGKPVLAAGGAGGVKIPNALYEVLTQFVLCGRTLDEAVAAPRMHCTGTTDVSLESTFPQTSADSLRAIGFKVTTAPAALVSAVHYNPSSGECRAVIR
jgi:gamma-glutamyltranspeptidase/glutathione hydrolase